MDTSAAVLSEVYGHATAYKLDNLRLAKARVRSNIQDTALLDALPYVPVQAGLDPSSSCANRDYQSAVSARCQNEELIGGQKTLGHVCQGSVAVAQFAEPVLSAAQVAAPIKILGIVCIQRAFEILSGIEECLGQPVSITGILEPCEPVRKSSRVALALQDITVKTREEIGRAHV